RRSFRRRRARQEREVGKVVVATGRLGLHAAPVEQAPGLEAAGQPAVGRGGDANLDIGRKSGRRGRIAGHFSRLPGFPLQFFHACQHGRRVAFQPREGGERRGVGGGERGQPLPVGILYLDFVG